MVVKGRADCCFADRLCNHVRILLNGFALHELLMQTVACAFVPNSSFVMLVFYCMLNYERASMFCMCFVHVLYSYHACVHVWLLVRTVARFWARGPVAAFVGPARRTRWRHSAAAALVQEEPVGP